VLLDDCVDIRLLQIIGADSRRDRDRHRCREILGNSLNLVAGKGSVSGVGHGQGRRSGIEFDRTREFGGEHVGDDRTMGEFGR
jgi:hypothetical protein